MTLSALHIIVILQKMKSTLIYKVIGKEFQI